MTPTFNCSQQELYEVGRLGWASVTVNLAQFTAFKAKYVALFITAREAEIDAAEALPDEEQREEDSRTFRVTLKTKATAGMELWQTLKRYITEAYPENELEIKLDAAGQQHYRKAGKDDWAAVKRLMLDGNAFITDNTVALSAGGNMPATFAVDFTTAKTEIDDAYTNFMSTSQNNEIATQTKTTANNDVHAKLMSMFLDGQQIFRNNEAVKKLFTFDQVLLTVAGPGATGLKGTVKNSNTNLPIGEPGATITFVGTGEDTITEGDGKYQKIIAEGTYTIEVVCVGYQTQTIPGVEVSAGIMRTQNITLVPLP